MSTYRNGKKQVAYRNGVPQVAYRNGEQVLDAPLPQMYELTVALNEGNYGYSQILWGDIEPNRFLGFTLRTVATTPSSNIQLQVSLTNWLRAYQNGYRQTFVVTRLDTYATAEPTSNSQSIGTFQINNSDRAYDFIKTDEVGDIIPLHIAVRCEFDLELSTVFDGGLNYVFNSTRGTLVPEFVNDDFQVIEIRTNTSTEITTIILSIFRASTPEVLDSSWKLLVWQYDLNDNLLGKAKLTWSELNGDDHNVFTVNESVFTTSSASKFVFQIGQYP